MITIASHKRGSIVIQKSVDNWASDKNMAKFNKQAIYWRNEPIPSIYSSSANIGQLVLNALNLTCNRVAQIDSATGRSATGREIQIRSIRVAQSLRALQVCEGHVIAIASSVSIHVPPIVFSGFLLGAPVNTLDPDFKTGKSEDLLELDSTWLFHF